MKISLSWLKDYLDTDLSVDELVALLIQLGHELDAVETEGASFAHVVVGSVQERVQHPDADRLGVCQVDVGEGNLRTIVCGAPNARAGIKVAVALPGAVLPGDFAIKKSKVRGVASDGMLCSVKELGFGDDHDGIWEMDTDAAVGTPLAQAINLDDVILDVAVTPNRGDCLSVYGLARDLAAAGAGTLKVLLDIAAGEGAPTTSFETRSDNVKGFSGTSLTGVQNGESPDWLKRRIEQAGLRPRSLVVDVTNYVMLTVGQPLHAYDADKLKGTVYAAEAQGGEGFSGIGERELTLCSGDVTICDDTGIIGLGGILGGEGTAVSATTQNIFLEAAFFERSRIAQTGQAHQLITDARYRFERGVDPEMVAYANQMAADLIVQYGGGVRSETVVSGTFDVEREVITYNSDLCRTFGGLDVSKEEQTNILQKLGFGIDDKGDVLSLAPPSWRTYMENPEDIVEEILRVKGYENVPTELPSTPLFKLPQSEAAPLLTYDRQARRALAGLGYLETITYSFINRTHAELFADDADALQDLDNPLDADMMATMRPSLLPGLLVASARNIARSEPISKLAEVGTVFTAEGEKLEAAGVCVCDDQRHWKGSASAPDAYTAKAGALALLESFGLNIASLQVKTPAGPQFHPGRSGSLVLGKQVLARFGELHPNVAKQFDLKGRASAFVVDLQVVSKQKIKNRPFETSAYQAVERDLAFLLDEDVVAQQVVRTVQNATKPLAKAVEVFDIYVGKGVPEGKKSLALSVTLQAQDRTLEEKDIVEVMDAAVMAVQKHYGGELRS
ncbi:MAG: phenylalanine--tRNA ligase subunit beta [Alphaproteobacteria bacterium]|nr:phenylalanine--tRNA ligase subunit beta [Alphaproteobacteria bacterium]MDD9920033.1 phenylalanine--tRNA ligase subunit beta [Alphaproteobacteria bacterium]